ncbi:Zinc finger SWIM domain-containing protein 3 [Phytophthora citrophthora]|uniref:Zinc finger SWIM domain-containing protein 3 n=1 Tax=Phytophthora citrophthora TaxID=4793 RepID=A0AAD9GIQ1_9STRA|nr:Zinc finger SWIM domain-containing protein 3 [Phytophthora citrophthora]
MTNWYKSWEEFHTSLSKHQNQTHQLFRLRSSTSVSQRNKQEVHVYAWMTSQESGQGPANDFVQQVDTTRGSISRFGTKNVGTHNHSLGRRQFDNHPSNRRIDEPGLVELVRDLSSACSKAKLIMQHLRLKSGQYAQKQSLYVYAPIIAHTQSYLILGKQATLRDVHNLVAKLKAMRNGSASVEERLKARLREFCTQSGNTATVFIDDAKTAQTITLQSQQMRRFFKAFPEVMLVDATHNTNDAMFKLFSFMVHDVYRHGQYVQHSLMENESEECLRDAISAFKEFNPTWEETKVIIIGKDFGELALLEREFSQAKSFVPFSCKKKYLRTEMTKREYGGTNSLNTKRAEDSIDMMLKATTLDEYTIGLKCLFYLLDNVKLRAEDPVPHPKHTFLQYFMRNWGSCRQLWAAFGRAGIPHLGNNRRARDFMGYLKDILKSTMGLDECVDTLIFLQSVLRT